VDAGGVQHEPTLANYAWQILQKQCKVADFGIRRQLEETLGEASTFVGTMIYMAPERIGKGGKYRYPSDIWSVGLTLLTLAAGKFPYEDCSFWSLAGAIENDPAPLHVLDECLKKNGLPSSGDGISNGGLGFSAEFRDFIDQMLQKDPNKRPSAHRLLRHKFFMKHGLRLQHNNITPPKWTTSPQLPSFASESKSKKRIEKAETILRAAALKMTTEGIGIMLQDHMHAPFPPSVISTSS